MKAALVIFGILGAIVGGLVALFTLGEAAAIILVLLLVGAVVYGFRAKPAVLRGLLIGTVVVFVGSAAFATWQGVQIASALSGESGPVDPPDAAALASAEAKIDLIEDTTAFRLEFTEDELTAVIQDGLTENTDHPVRRVDIDLVAPESDGEAGRLEFAARFKSGSLSADGAVTARLRQGAVQIRILDLGIGSLNIPGVAEDALEDLIESIADLNETLDRNKADVQSVEITDTSVVIVGTQGGTDLLTSAELLADIQAQAAAAGAAVEPPPERFGPGVVNSTSAPGSPVYVALGDSLAANVGVTQAQDGYVSRFHNQLQIRDGRSYGLRNFGVSGETSGSMIRTGQLDDAVAFMDDNDVAYVTIDIGANDLLGHLSSADCSEDFDGSACQQRVQNSFDLYATNIEEIFDEIENAAPDATVIFMRVYNPFSLGFGGEVAFEQQSNEAVSSLNDIGADAATARGFLVADAFTPMLGTTAATTHMVDSPPDIHPRPIGFDVLAGALVDALS